MIKARVLFNALLGGAGLLASLGISPARADTRILLTLEWPPYTSLSEPGGGTMSVVVNKAFKAIGDDTRIGFFSWHRVLELPRSDRRFAGIFPIYYSEERAKTCYFSDPIGESTIGLAEPRAAPLKWQVADDLKGHRIGVVQGYVNSPRFDQLMAGHEVPTLAGETDAANLKNLLAGKVEAAVVDPNVFHYLNTHEVDLSRMDSTLDINPQVLTRHALYLCFPKDHAGFALRQRFNRGLHQVLANSPVLPDERPRNHP